jgi:hypothetical protein
LSLWAIIKETKQYTTPHKQRIYHATNSYCQQ